MRPRGDPLRISAAGSRFVAPPVGFAASVAVAALPPSALSSGGVRECSGGPAPASDGEPVHARGNAGEARGRDAVVSGIRQRRAVGSRADARGGPGRPGRRVSGGAAGSRPPDPGGGVAGRDHNLRPAGRPDTAATGTSASSSAAICPGWPACTPGPRRSPPPSRPDGRWSSC